MIWRAHTGYRLFALQQARRGFAATAAASQQHRDRGPSGAITPGDRQSRYKDPQYGPPRGEKSIRHDEQPRGRYSGQPLQPEQVLDQLSTPRPTPTPARVYDPAHVYLKAFPALEAKLQAFAASQSRAEPKPLSTQWSILRSIAEEKGATGLQQHGSFHKNYIKFAASTCNADWGGEGSNRTPRPSEVLAMMHLVGVEDRLIWSKTLWRMARTILAAAPSPSAQHGDLVDELVRLWNMALSARLARGPASASPLAAVSGRVPLKWSFLPSLPDFMGMMAQRRPVNGAKLQLDAALALLLPQVESADKHGQGPQAPKQFDYASTALVTIDLLRQQPTAQRRPTQGPLAEMLEGIFRTVASPGVPRAMRDLLAGPGPWDEGALKTRVRGVTERLDIDGTGPTQSSSTEKDKGSIRPSREAAAAAKAGQRKIADDVMPPSTEILPSDQDADAGGRSDASSAAERQTAVAPPPTEILPIDQDSDTVGKSDASSAAEKQTAVAASPDKADVPAEKLQTSGVAVYSYAASGEGELALSKGEGVLVLEADAGDGWILVRALASGGVAEAEGYVPTSYVALNQSADNADTSPGVDNGGDGTDAAQADLSTADVHHDQDRKTAQSPDHSPATAGQDNVPAAARTKDRVASASRTKTSGGAPQDRAVVDRFTNLRIHRLSQAMEKQDLSIAEAVKREVLRHPTDPPLKDQMYEHLMYALLCLRGASSAIEVWNYFNGPLGRTPTAKTYTVMMRGAQYVRDVHGMEAFWAKMRAAGVQPDDYAWTLRIQGLIRGGRVDDGLKALAECGQEWVGAARAKHAAATGGSGKKGGGKALSPQGPELTAAQAGAMFDGPIEGIPRPTVVTLNAAISALSTRADQHIPKVLSWGRAFGLEPDEKTYNVLLNVSMRHGHFEEGMAILQRMHDKGIPTTADTWTILLAQVFEGGSLDDLSHAEQEQRILAILTSLESTSAQANIDQKGYALAVDRLLKFFNNTSAANAVLAHMIARGVEPSSHIYTILMTSYFAREPSPDFAAVEALDRRIQNANGGRGALLDSIFYDRMLEGYAKHHRAVDGTRQLRRLLDRMRKESRRPSWTALELVARALADRGEWDFLLAVVDEARSWVKEEGHGKRGEAEMLVGKRAFGQRDFWQFVVQTGLLRDEGVTSPDQMMREKTGQTPIERRLGLDGREKHRR
ncbi:hypothetical protein LTR53_006690 [Teratosphaeriaceae sp. CCFEE 6253]|nr:hypothetical protein LTR53_006690 [Teratosphaeriaceae sp. CCFEE 6253]